MLTTQKFSLRGVLCFFGQMILLVGCMDQPAAQPDARAQRQAARVEADDFERDQAFTSTIARAARSRLKPPVDPSARIGSEINSAVTVSDGTSKPGLVGSLRSFVQSSQAFEDAEITDELDESLASAEEILAKAKQSNRNAIKQVNRQIRVGAARFSPNLILVEFERLEYGALGCYGGTPTPAFDRVAADGQQFTNFYSGSVDFGLAGYCLLTGRGPGHVLSVYKPGEPLTLPAFGMSDVLWRSGYVTGFFGLWDNPELPISRGYDEWMGYASRKDVTAYPEFLALDSKQMRLVANANGAAKIRGNEALVHEAAGFVARIQQSKRPWFLHLVLPIDPAADLPATSPSSSESNRSLAEKRLRSWDADLGTLLSKLEALKLEKNVCLIVTARSGALPATVAEKQMPTSAGLKSASHGLCEANLRIPLIVRWPGTVAAGSTNDSVCVSWDLLPTLAEIAHAIRRAAVDGRSFRQTLLNGAPVPDRLLFWQSTGVPLAQAVRLGQWKGIHVQGQPAVTLFDLNLDPTESTNVAADHPDVVAKMMKPSFENALKQTSDLPGHLK